MCLPICGSHTFAQEAESYAVFDKATNTLTFKHDTQKPYGAFALNEGENLPGWNNLNDIGCNTNIIWKVIFDASFAKARPTSCSKWFYGCDELTFIEGIEYLNTENVTNMSHMFRNCRNLKTLDLSSFDTKNVTDMSNMFNRCEALTTLDLSSFNTKNVTDMECMFSDCSKLTTLNLSSFNTKRVEYMNAMFEGCSALTTLDVSNFDTQNVPYMSEMFSNCSALTTLDVSNFNTEKVTDMSDMFSGCSALTTLNLSNFNTKHVTDMDYMFGFCEALTTLDISSFYTKNVTNMRGMFYRCSALKTLDLSSFNTKRVEYMNSMFEDCSALTTLDLSNFYTQNVTDMGEMFKGCSALTSIYASYRFVTTACEEDEDMFKYCTNLVGAVPYDENKVGSEMANYATGYFIYKAPKIKGPYAVFDESTNTLTFKHDNNTPTGIAFELDESFGYPDWYNPDYNGYNTNIIKKVVFDASFANARPTSCHDWFYGCKDLTTIEGIEYLNTENVTSMGAMFWGCSALTTLDVSNFDTQNVTDMSLMFRGCSALTTLDVSNFDTQNVTYMSWMFSNCSALTTLDLSNFDTQNVRSMGEMFCYCSALTTIYASEKYVTTACANDYFDAYMFKNCTNLVGAVPYDENKMGKEMANYTTGYFTYKAATGIDALTVSDDTSAEYYDLQGRRLNAPQKGVNIVKRGKKTTKVLVK